MNTWTQSGVSTWPNIRIEAGHQIFNAVCMTSKGSHQPAHMRSLTRAFASPLNILWLLTEHHLEFLSFKGGCTGLSESTLVKMSHCWKLRVTAHLMIYYEYAEQWAISQNTPDRRQSKILLTVDERGYKITRNRVFFIAICRLGQFFLRILTSNWKELNYKITPVQNYGKSTNSQGIGIRSEGDIMFQLIIKSWCEQTL